MPARIRGRHRAMTIVVVLALGAAAAAEANHSHPATYTGRIAGGGTIEFDVSADGSAVTRVKVADVSRGSCTVPETEIPMNAAVTNHAFSHQDDRITINGSFSTARIAEGTLTLTSVPAPSAPACSTGALPWNATTSVAPPPPPPPDTAAPRTAIAAAAKQRLGAGVLVLRVTCPDEPCTATARGTLTVRGVASQFRLGQVSASAPRGVRTTMRLKLSKKALVAARRALAKRRSVTARLSVTTADAAGNRSQATRTVRFRR